MESQKPKVALVPHSLLECDHFLKGVAINNSIVAFFNQETKGVDTKSMRGWLKGSEIRLENGTIISTVIVLPDTSDNGKLVCIDRFIEDDLVRALSLYTQNVERLEIKPKNSASYALKEYIVSDVLVRFCKATSLSSEVASNGKDVTWNHVSMTMAVRSKPIASKIAKWLDVVLGVAAIILLCVYWSALANFVDAQLAFEDRTLKERVEFVMQRHAPLGFKLNPQADFVLGNLVILVVDAWRKLVSYPTAFGKEFVILACTAAAILNRGIGLSVLYSVAFDGFAILSTHVGVLHRVISRILRFQLRLIGSLALLMRGKKRNMLRIRVDTLKTDSAQLMLGTMAIFFFFFTLQTTLAYHILVLAVWFLVFLTQCALFFVCVLLRTLPIDEFFIAWKDRGCIDAGKAPLNPHHFYLKMNEKNRQWHLVVVPVTMSDVLREWMSLVGRHWTKAWTRRWGAQRVFWDVLFGHELPSVPPPEFCS